MSEEKKPIELKDEELEKVTGGDGFDVGNTFGVSAACADYINNWGTWFNEDLIPDFTYTVCYASYGVESFIANKYWYKNNEAWYCGTCSIGSNRSFHVISTPTTVHNELTPVKPF